jgi:tetratricopeptide (TPR) repeat protein
MPTAFSKTVFIACAPEDLPIALELRGVLQQLIGPQVWVKDIDLKAGALVAEALNTAMTEAKWFILLLSHASASSQWVRNEANLATIRSIEDEDFRVAVFRVDDAEPPAHFSPIVEAYKVTSIASVEDRDKAFLALAVEIEATLSTPSKRLVYVDRGGDADQFTLAARRNRIIFIVGWAGIGKSAFVKHSVSQQLRKHPLTVTLTRGHSTDLLCRQILHQARLPQPLGASAAQTTEDEWRTMAIAALEQRSDSFFLFVDNAEQAIDPASELLPYLSKLLVSFAASQVQTHIVLATTRVPDFPAEIGAAGDVVHLEGLKEPYIRECIDVWLEGDPRHDRAINAVELDEIIAMIAGHPLAAKMIASYLKTKSPQQLLESKQARRIQLKLAEYVLRAADHSLLTDLHQLILHVLAGIAEPVAIQDLMAVRDIAARGIDAVQKARWDLADWYLVEQTGDLMYLPKFFEAYFRERLNLKEGRFERLARDYGVYALERAVELNKRLASMSRYSPEDRDDYMVISGEVFRYSIPSGRLLRAVGEDNLALRLPIEVKGTLREMVFHFYQTEQNYGQALAYAERWLLLSPGDLEIMLYRVRCYRNIGGLDYLAKADKLLQQLERKDMKRGFSARICRERALIADRRGDTEAAKSYFRKGIDDYTVHGYPDNHIGLAHLLLREIDETSFLVEHNQELAREALLYLDQARDLSATFDRFHLGTYVEALIQAGYDETALPLLQVVLKDRPEDSRLNYRLAEILRKRDEFRDAERYARAALRFGAKKANLTLANVYYGWALQFQAEGQPGLMAGRLREALASVNGFVPEFGHDKEVADSLATKILCALGDVAAARDRIMGYVDSQNPYTVYEQCRVLSAEAEIEFVSERYAPGVAKLRSAVQRIEEFARRHALTQRLHEFLTELRAREAQVRSAVE